MPIARFHRLRRSPIAYWVLTGVLALSTASVVQARVDEAARVSRRFGVTVVVRVATQALFPGDVIEPHQVRRSRIPKAMLPDAPLPDDAVGHTIVWPVVAGEILTRAKLAPFGRHGVAALVPPGQRALGLPLDRATPPLRRGDIVDVLATFTTDTDTSDVGVMPPLAGPESDGAAAAPATPAPAPAPTFPVARRATVVDISEDTVTVAVSIDEAPRVAFAATTGAVTLAIVAD